MVEQQVQPLLGIVNLRLEGGWGSGFDTRNLRRENGIDGLGRSWDVVPVTLGCPGKFVSIGFSHQKPNENLRYLRAGARRSD
jgi:hypothetical protein